MLRRLRRLLRLESMPDEEFRAQQAAILEKTPVPVIWMFGKTGSGKTSIVRYLTGADEAEIGNGFRPQTRHSRQYDFPATDHPLVRFLDTRGLGEGHYDPDEDIQRFNEVAHVMIVTVRVMDHALEPVLEPLRLIRRAEPRRPVVLALTCLHMAYPQQQHPAADPFTDSWLPDGIPPELERCLKHHGEQFSGLVDAVVPLDLTRREDGFAQPDFGGERLKARLLELLPAAYRQTLLDLDDTLGSLRDLYERRAAPYIISSSMMAATAATVPIPWVDLPVVAALQSHLIYRLAVIYGQKVDARRLLEMLAPLGARMLLRMVVREAAKFVPFLGIAVNSAMAYAYTYGLGKACCWYFGRMRQGYVPTTKELEQVWHEQLTLARALWSKHHSPEVQK